MTNISKQLIDAYPLLQERGDAIVLATIIETQGSTYQKAGARMLITVQEELIGLLGGGCFEQDLIEQAKVVFDTGLSKLLFYDTRTPSDEIWGLGLGCHGAMKILLQRLDVQNNYRPLDYLSKAAAFNFSTKIAIVYDSEHSEYLPGYTITPDNYSLDELSCHVYNGNHQNQCELLTVELDHKKIHLLVQTLVPARKLLILGAGPDTLPLIELSSKLGWKVTVIDHRASYLKKIEHLDSIQLLLDKPERLNEHLNADDFIAAIIMTHNLDKDAQYLKQLIPSQIPYLGVLGPAHRKKRILDNLGFENNPLTQRVFGPIGLDIGAQTPEEIALSIVSGILTHINNRTGHQLGFAH